MTEIELSPKQCEFIRNATHRYNGKIGATRCGKTYIDITYVIINRILERRDLSGLNVILGVTKETIERNVLEPMREIWGAKYITDINSRNVCMIFGEKVYCLGSEKVSQVSKLRGSTIKYVYIDELVDANEEVFQLLKSRLSLTYSICDFTGNPSHPDHFVKKFIDSDVDVYTQNWTIYDNPFLATETVKALESEYAGTVYFDRYILGKWKRAEGRVYPQFDENINVFDDEISSSGTFYVSVDYGTMNPFAAGLWKIQNKVAYRVKEFYYSGRDEKKQKTDEEYYKELERLIGGRVVESIVVDPSAASFIALIYNKGRYSVTKAKNDVLDGIRNTAKYIKNGQIKFHKSCINGIREMQSYSWDNKATEDKVIKENDHVPDDVRYFVNTIFDKEM